MGENKHVYRVALLSMMIALSHVGRLVFSFLPNVQPVTVIVLMFTLVFGIRDGLIVGILSIVLSNMTLGMGVWTFAQVASYGVLVLLTGILRPFQKYVWFDVAFALYAGVAGYLYGFIISAVQAPFFGIQKFWVYYMAGIPFDTMHALGNVGFYIILAPVLLPLLRKAAIKLEIT